MTQEQSRKGSLPCHRHHYFPKKTSRAESEAGPAAPPARRTPRDNERSRTSAGAEADPFPFFSKAGETETDGFSVICRLVPAA